MENKFAIAIKCIACLDGKVLLLTKAEHERKGDASDSSWDLPGGRVNYKETLEDAAKREMHEETSLNVDQLHFKLATTLIRPDGLHLLIVTYLCNCDSENVILSNEHISHNWLSIKEIIDNDTIPDWIKDTVYTINEDEI